MFRFSWDSAKASTNVRKHGVTFEEAAAVFFDDFGLLYEDPEAAGERRYILLGVSNLHRVLVGVHCETGLDGNELRIISARKATLRERDHYMGGGQ